MARGPRDPDKEKKDREEQERLDRAERDKVRAEQQTNKRRQREIRDREERIRPDRVMGTRPVIPRPGQLLHDAKERKYLRFNDDRAEWEEVERHRACDHWVRKGDPVDLHVHECVGNRTPSVVFQCANCQAKYRMVREKVDTFRFTYRNECPTCSAPLPDEPRDALEKDFR